MFVFAAWCGVGGVAKSGSDPIAHRACDMRLRGLLFAFMIVMTWHAHLLESLIPKWMIKAIYPIDKTDLDMLRFTHFLALAVWCRDMSRATGGRSRQLAASAQVLCGQHSLPIFCLGVFLSFGAHWILVQYSTRESEQIGVSVAGFVIMTAVGMGFWIRPRRCPTCSSR